MKKSRKKEKNICPCQMREKRKTSKSKVFVPVIGDEVDYEMETKVKKLFDFNLN